MAMDVNELLPCPFCGEKADVVSKLRAAGEQFWCVCLNDDCTFYNAEVLNTHARKFDAIAAWNRRAPLSADEERAAQIDAIAGALWEMEKHIRAATDHSHMRESARRILMALKATPK
jgi:hypothetical protein